MAVREWESSNASGLPPLQIDRLVNAQAGTGFPAALFRPIPTVPARSEASLTPSSAENGRMTKRAAGIMPDNDMAERPSSSVRTFRSPWLRAVLSTNPVRTEPVRSFVAIIGFRATHMSLSL